MNEWIAEIGMFFVQTTIVMALIGIVLLLIARTKQDKESDLKLYIEPLNDQRRRRGRRLRLTSTLPGARKKLIKAFRTEDKKRQKAAKVHQDTPLEPRVWVLDFHGDLKASQTEHFAQEVSAIIDVAAENDEVVVRLESAGGLVHAYGLAAAQLDRLRTAGLTTTVCIDKVAASGGYLMACTAQHIKAA